LRKNLSDDIKRDRKNVKLSLCYQNSFLLSGVIGAARLQRHDLRDNEVMAMKILRGGGMCKGGGKNPLGL
jgi:hypothetical protein